MTSYFDTDVPSTGPILDLHEFTVFDTRAAVFVG